MTPAKYVMFQKHLFVPWRYVYGECAVLRNGAPQTWPLMCLQTDCPRNRGCMETVAKRVTYWFDYIEPGAKALYAYFKHNDTLGLGFFTRKNDTPCVRFPVNVSALNKFLSEGETKDIILPAEYLNIHGVYATPTILPVIS